MTIKHSNKTVLSNYISRMTSWFRLLLAKPGYPNTIPRNKTGKNQLPYVYLWSSYTCSGTQVSTYLPPYLHTYIHTHTHRRNKHIYIIQNALPKYVGNLNLVECQILGNLQAWVIFTFNYKWKWDLHKTKQDSTSLQYVCCAYSGHKVPDCHS